MFETSRRPRRRDAKVSSASGRRPRRPARLLMRSSSGFYGGRWRSAWSLITILFDPQTKCKHYFSPYPDITYAYLLRYLSVQCLSSKAAPRVYSHFDSILFTMYLQSRVLFDKAHICCWESYFILGDFYFARLCSTKKTKAKVAHASRCRCAQRQMAVSACQSDFTDHCLSDRKR